MVTLFQRCGPSVVFMTSSHSVMDESVDRPSKRQSEMDWTQGHHGPKSSKSTSASVAPQILPAARPTSEAEEAARQSQMALLNVLNQSIQEIQDAVPEVCRLWRLSRLSSLTPLSFPTIQTLSDTDSRRSSLCAHETPAYNTPQGSRSTSMSREQTPTASTYGSRATPVRQSPM